MDAVQTGVQRMVETLNTGVEFLSDEHKAYINPGNNADAWKQIVHEAVRAGLIERRPDAKDWQLTEKGRSIPPDL